MNKYTHLSDLERKKAMLPVLTEVLKIVSGEDVELSLSSTHETLLLKLGSELRTVNVECDNALGMLKDVVKKI
mgnify:FL=1